tara:strand:+ start:273 stop:533 length:261 start_codon:yes stop_codon:yes gene_type:complete
MKAVGNNIVIEPEKTVNEKTKGGLLLVEKNREDIRYKKATIISVSDEIKNLKVGDKIYYDKAAGHGIEFLKQKYIVIKLQDIVVVL